MQLINVMSLTRCFEFVVRNNYEHEYVIISIQDAPFGNGIQFTKSDKCKDILTLYFDDIETNLISGKLFSNKQAKEIIKFVKKYRDIHTLIIHCRFGQSRSTAVAKFIYDKMFKCEVDFMEGRPYPNDLVYRILIKEL